MLTLFAIPFVNNFENLKVHDGGGRRLEKSKNHYISTTV